MGRTRQRTGAGIAAGTSSGGPARRVGLLGGSFNPAHRGHRRLSAWALTALDLDEIWWLVSPGNPLKAGARDMAPYAARLASARAMARGTRIRVSAFEAEAGTRFAVDTVRALNARYPRHRFIWLMGADIPGELHRWRDWRGFARSVPIAVIVRPGYPGLAGRGRGPAWLRRFVRPAAGARDWTRWSLPAIVPLHPPPSPVSATALRQRDPHWHLRPVAPILPPSPIPAA